MTNQPQIVRVSRPSLQIVALTAMVMAGCISVGCHSDNHDPHAQSPASSAKMAATTHAPDDAARLQALVAAAQSYSAERKGRLPSTLGVAWEFLPSAQQTIDRSVAEYYFRANSPKLNALPNPITPQWLSDQSDFTFLAPNRLNAIAGEKDLVIAHEKIQDQGAKDAILLAFADGRVTAVPKQAAAPMIESSKTRLASIKELARYEGEPAD